MTTKIKAEDAMFVVLDWLEPGKNAPRFVTLVTGAEATDDNPVKVVGVFESAEEAFRVTKELNDAEPEPEPEPEEKGEAVSKGKGKGEAAGKGKGEGKAEKAPASKGKGKARKSK